MNTKIIIGTFIVLIVLVIIGIFGIGVSKDHADLDNDFDLTVVKEELNRLPYEITVRDRGVVLDRESIEKKSREKYAQLPYEIEVGEETRLVELDTEIHQGESPIDFVKSILEDQVPPQSELDAYSETMFQYFVSLHLLSEDVVVEYPIKDHPDAESAKEGISVYIRSMNFPDDSIGGNEKRYDFIVSENDNWILVWVGERNFCRRPDQEFWQPADKLCP